jgi:phosphosulfolactate phosphohydrolase-like enzyme
VGGGSRGRSRSRVRLPSLLPLPASLLGVPAGTRVELASPNGASVALAAAGAGAVVLAGCVSGRELAARCLAADLALAAEHDVSTTVPRLAGGAFAQLS